MEVMPALSRRHFCLTASSLLARSTLSAPAADANAILLGARQASQLQQAIQHDGAYRAAALAVAQAAHAALKAGPWSVTTHRPGNVPAGPNDYYSEGPY